MTFTRRDVVAGAAGMVGASWLAEWARAADGPEWEPAIAAARKEGSLVLSTGLESPVMRTIFKNFEAKYGVRVDSLVGRPSEVRERIRIAEIAGRQQVDVVFGSEALTNIRYSEEKSVADVPPIIKADLARTTLKSDVQFLPQITITYGLFGQHRDGEAGG
jgi:hypothetical protein